MFEARQYPRFAFEHRQQRLDLSSQLYIIAALGVEECSTFGRLLVECRRKHFVRTTPINQGFATSIRATHMVPRLRPLHGAL